MSTGWITEPPVDFDELRRADLGSVYVAEVEETTNDQFALTDGKGFLWVFRHPDGHATYSSFVDSKNEDSIPVIQDAVDAVFDVVWYSEHDPEFHGEDEDEDEDEDDQDDPSSRLSAMAMRVAGLR